MCTRVRALLEAAAADAGTTTSFSGASAAVRSAVEMRAPPGRGGATSSSVAAVESVSAAGSEAAPSAFAEGHLARITCTFSYALPAPTGRALRDDADGDEESAATINVFERPMRRAEGDAEKITPSTGLLLRCSTSASGSSWPKRAGLAHALVLITSAESSCCWCCWSSTKGIE